MPVVVACINGIEKSLYRVVLTAGAFALLFLTHLPTTVTFTPWYSD